MKTSIKLLFISFLFTGSLFSQAPQEKYFFATFYEGTGLSASPARVQSNPHNTTNVDSIASFVGLTDTVRTSIFELKDYVTLVPIISNSASADSAHCKVLLYSASKNQYRPTSLPLDSEFTLAATLTGVTATPTQWKLHESAYSTHQYWYALFIGTGDVGLVAATTVKLHVSTR